ncbi:hypothetical protein Bca4012_025748 [Brassica carinata]
MVGLSMNTQPKMKQGDSTVREYNTLFLKSGLHEKHDEETLVSMYREGLRDDIRAEIGFQVFSTIDDIMQASLDVEEDKEEEDEAEADDTHADNDSDGSLPQPLGGSDDESDSKVDLEDYKEYLEEHHKTDSESSRESK